MADQHFCLYSKPWNIQACQLLAAAKRLQPKSISVFILKNENELDAKYNCNSLPFVTANEIVYSDPIEFSLKYGLSNENDKFAFDWYRNMFLPVISNVFNKSENSCNELFKILETFINDIKPIASAFFLDFIWFCLYPIIIGNILNIKEEQANIVEWFRERDSLKSCVNEISGHIEESYGIHEFSKSLTLKIENKIDQKEIDDAVKSWESETVTEINERIHPILPKENSRNILITSALPYVNNVPHLGNIIGCVLSADVFSRYCRLRQYNSIFICGTDEYGTATEAKALQDGVTEQELCDKYHKLHSDVYKWFNIDFDFFGRTTTEKHAKIAKDIFWRLYDNGYISKDVVEQLFCLKCSKFLADRFVTGICPFCQYIDARGDQCDKCGKLINAIELKEPKCSICHTLPKVKSTNHLFLDLLKLQDKVDKFLDERFVTGVWSLNAQRISKTWIRDGLRPRCITRDLKWGVNVPLDGYNNKVFYVWYDAPIGYISITANYTDDWEKWWKNPKHVENFEFMAKDNVPFHSIIFPCTLLGTEDSWTTVSSLSATEYLNYEDSKFSKSRGIGIFGNDAEKTEIPADIYRFYLLYIRPETQDSTFQWDDFLAKNNTELLNNFGNFINRSLVFVNKFFKDIIPPIELNDEDKQMLSLINREIKDYIKNLENQLIREGIKCIFNISRYGNQYLQVNQPWKKLKISEVEKKRGASVIGFSANIACLLSVLVQPYMPATSEIIQKQLNAPKNVNIVKDFFYNLLPTGHKIGKASPLFAKIEEKQITNLKLRFNGIQKENIILSPKDIDKLNKDIETQAKIVRELKNTKSEKSVVDEQIKILLDLKSKLSITSNSNKKAKKQK